MKEIEKSPDEIRTEEGDACEQPGNEHILLHARIDSEERENKSLAEKGDYIPNQSSQTGLKKRMLPRLHQSLSIKPMYPIPSTKLSRFGLFI